jgi:hypothetical protein
MSLITDPTFLLAGDSDLAATPGPELVIDTTALTIALVPGVGDLTLASSGATGQALFSALKILWKNSDTFIRFPFPMEAITPEQFEFINGWLPANDVTRKAIRTAGWTERDAGGTVLRRYAGIISLGALGATDQPYYQQEPAGVATNFAFPGPVNEPVHIFGNVDNGNFDRRTTFRMFAREQQKEYANANLDSIGVSLMTTIVYRFPLANSADSKVLVDDAGIASDPGTYDAIEVAYYSTDQLIDIGGVDYPFRVLIEGNGATLEEIYTKVQFLLRQNSNIDVSFGGSVIGRTADQLMAFVGDTLVTGQGVFVDSFDSNDTNRITLTDQNSVPRTYPFVAAGTIAFNSNLAADGAAIYRMYFTTLPGLGNDFGEDGAVLVEEPLGNEISGDVTGGSVSFSFNYDTNNQGGRTPGTDAEVTVVAIGLTTAQYVSAQATITRTTGQNISLVAPLERNFANA